MAALVGATLATTAAQAERLAMLPLEAPGQKAPHVAAEKLAAELIARGHRVLTSADVLARISMGNQGAGADWAAEVKESIDAARAALTRLNRGLALSMARRIGEDVVHRGGGAGGADVLVSWCLLERQLSLTASDPKGGAAWLDRAVAMGPNVELDPLRHPDEERDRFARRRASLRTESLATLSVATTPTAEIWVDGIWRCQSPCTITLLAGRHFARASSAAHQPAVFEIDLAPGGESSRRVGLSAAYSGASPQAISAMLSDPSRRVEGASALEPLARFLDVDHAVALYPEPQGVRVILSPPPPGRAKLGRTVDFEQLSPAVVDELTPLARSPEEPTPWYARPGTWIASAGIVAGVIGGILIYGASRPGKTATVTVMSSP
jgi:hypothetical protein